MTARTFTRSFWVGDVGPVEILIECTIAICLQLSEDAAEILTQGATMDSYMRRIGLGRVRADLSTPLEPPADVIWIAGVDGTTAMLYIRPTADDREVVRIELGEMSKSTRSTCRTFGTAQVLICVSDVFLPDSSVPKLMRERERKRAWGGLVSCVGG